MRLILGDFNAHGTAERVYEGIHVDWSGAAPDGHQVDQAVRNVCQFHFGQLHFGIRFYDTRQAILYILIIFKRNEYVFSMLYNVHII